MAIRAYLPLNRPGFDSRDILSLLGQKVVGTVFMRACWSVPENKEKGTNKLKYKSVLCSAATMKMTALFGTKTSLLGLKPFWGAKLCLKLL